MASSFHVVHWPPQVHGEGGRAGQGSAWHPPKLGRVLQRQRGSPGTAAHTGLSPHTLASVGLVLWLFSESPPLPPGLETTAVAGLVTVEEGAGAALGA